MAGKDQMNKMSVSTTYRNSSKAQPVRATQKVFQLAPIASAIAMVVATGSVTSDAHAQQVFSRAWYGKQQQQMQQMRATGVLPNGQPITNPQQQQQQSRDQLQRSWGNVNRAAQALAATLNAQQIARNNGGNVPVITVTDGVGGNGLVVDISKAWQNATLKNPVTENGQTKVTIEQDAARAIAYWDSFNVGKNTHVHFDQQGNSDWAILNKVSNSVAPSQIQGKVTADGTVLIVNNNGVVFTGTSQVNVRNLVAAATNISADQFNNNGIYSSEVSGSLQAAFTDAAGQVVVQQGAQIATNMPTTATQGGGYVLLLGQQVINEGDIQTEKGQTLLAAGDSFVIKKGVGTSGNLGSTTKGNEVVTQFNTGSLSGEVINRGVIIAKEGDITLAGNTVRQEGVVAATTTVNTRGTIHLNAVNKNTQNGSVTLTSDAVTAILIDDDGKTTALDSQRDALAAGVKIDQTFDVNTLPDRLDQSRIEINSADSVTFEGDSLTLATGGQIAVNAKGRVFAADQSQLDVSGAVGVSVEMKSNNIKINIQGNELRDSPANRDNGSLINNDAWVDRRDLILVPAGTGGYDSDRWYTSDGLLEVSGYLGNQGHRIGEWAAQGGTVTLAGNEVITQTGSVINLAGGTLDVATGYVNQTWVKGSDGKLYSLGDLPAGMTYTGVHKGFEVKDARWGTSNSYYNPLMARDQKLENGYTVGRDAGTLIISAPTAILEGTVDAQVFNGQQQTKVRNATDDGYKQAQTAAAQAGKIVLGQYNRYGKSNLFDSDVRIGDVADVTAGMGAADAIDAGRVNTVWFNADALNEMALGGINLGTRSTIVIDKAVAFADGANINLLAGAIDINANVTARSGSLTTSNLYATADVVSAQLILSHNGVAATTIADGVVIDMRGQWGNVLNNAEEVRRLAYVNGGSVNLSSTQDINIGQGSVIDVSAGGVVKTQSSSVGGRGGNVSLIADQGGTTANTNGVLTLHGELRGYGVTGGGKLVLETGQKIVLGDASVTVPAGDLHVDQQLLSSGFANYDLNGHQGVTVGDNSDLHVAMPVYQFVPGFAGQNSQEAGLALWTPPAYIDDIVKNTLTQRKGADITLRSQRMHTGGDITVGTGAVLSVDDGHTISLLGGGLSNIKVDGTLNAFGGKIAINVATPDTHSLNNVSEHAHDRAIVIDHNAVLDVSGKAVTAVGANGKHYGVVQNGGTIEIGGSIDWEANGQATTPDVAVVLASGSTLKASGTSGVLTLSDGNRVDQHTVASNGGTIVIKSMHSLYLDGTIEAHAGGAGAAGGTLGVALETPVFGMTSNSDNAVRAERELIISQDVVSSGIDDVGIRYGAGRLSVSQIENGGFDNLSVLVNGILSFDGDVTLGTKQSMRLYAGSYALSEAADNDASVKLASSYVRLAAPTRIAVDGQRMFGVTWRNGESARASDASFDVRADLVEVRDRVGFGAKGSIAMQGVPAVEIDRRGFTDVSITSTGDMRLLGGLGGRGLSGSMTTELTTGGNLTITAAQIYPVTHAEAQILAGFTYNSAQLGYNKGSLLDIRRYEGSEASMPLSVFGTLKLGADIVSQGGIVRAPLGNITLGADTRSGYYAHAEQVILKEGSITSVSAAGLTMPYGGTTDGTTYLYNGVKVTPPALGSNGITLNADSVVGEAGSVLDLSGGGELIGAGFVSGRGGSVNIINTPLANAGLVHSYSQSTNQVYAIVPSMNTGYAPVGAETGAGNPLIGQQITLTSDVAGLKAGTYTLLPSTYALLPGAYRVEVGGLTSLGASAATGTGSYVTAGLLGVANTDIRSQQANKLVITPADVVKQHSSFNMSSYDAFIVGDVQRHGGMRGKLTTDAATLTLDYANYRNGQLGLPVLQLDGTTNLSAKNDQEGFSGTVNVQASSIEILAAGEQATANWQGVSLFADALTALNAPRLIIGGALNLVYGDNYATFLGTASNVVVRSGATLRGADVFIMTGSGSGSITIEEGASINTVGAGKSSYDSSDGVVFAADGSNVLALSNGWINVLPSTTSTVAAGEITIGSCVSLNCDTQTTLLSEGTLAVATNKAFTMADNVQYGAKNLVLAMSAINMGSDTALADAAANGQLPAGLSMNQNILKNLLKGNQGAGIAAVETLVLNAAESVNLYGAVEFDTVDAATGLSSIERFVLGTPAIYGYGEAGDKAIIKTGEFVWTGSDKTPGAAIGGLLGDGSLDISAERIVLGHAPNTQSNSTHSYDRLAIGFSHVNLNASQSITSNAKGTLGVYHQQGNYVSGTGYQYNGGELHLTAPVLTGASGSSSQIRAGGNLVVTGSTVVTPATGDTALGAVLKLAGTSVTVDGHIALASGQLTLDAQEDVTLTDRAQIDLSGQAVKFFEQTRYSKGGDLLINSAAGNITQAAGSVIDVSATHNRGGAIKVVALGEQAGHIALAGTIKGGSSGTYDAGGTYVPYSAAELTLRAQTIDDFASLNQRLNDGDVFGARRFQLKQGDLVVGDEVKARHVEIVADGGDLTVNGKIDASGFEVGSIRLAAKDDLIINGTLDAHGTGVRVDSYGKVIESPNRAIVDLTTRDGVLSLGNGAVIDVRAGTNNVQTNLTLGTVSLNAPRVGSNDVAVNVAATPVIRGAKSVFVNAFRTYDDAPLATLPDVSGSVPQLITQAYLDGIDTDSTAFIDAALSNANLTSRLQGLGDYRLRPGVEIISNATTNPGGHLTITEDLDLSAYRYGPDADRMDPAKRGFGEAGVLVIRPEGDLTVHGSINDGFAPPPDSPDDAGWILTELRTDVADRGMTPYGTDIVVPIDGVVLDVGTQFPVGAKLNYAIAVEAMTLPSGLILPVDVVLSGSYTLLSGAVLKANVYNADGSVLHAAGTVLKQNVMLFSGQKLGAGTALRSNVDVTAMIWPKDTALPVAMTTTATTTLARGALIPSMTKVELIDDKPVDLRPNVNGKQGKNWALAAMLPQGTTSWDLQLTAGADTGSADYRATDVSSKGSVKFVDTHSLVDAKLTPGGTGLVWTEEGAVSWLGDASMIGQPISEQEIENSAICDWWPTACAIDPIRIETKWTLEGSIGLFGNDSMAGVVVEEWGIDYCAEGPNYCSQTISPVRDVIKHVFYAPGYSVVRTGTGDIGIAAAGDVRMDSPFGIYTAGTPSTALLDANGNDPFNLARVTPLGTQTRDYTAALSAYQAWYPEHGGNLTIAAGGDVIGDSWGNGTTLTTTQLISSSLVGNWLWRQGTGNTEGLANQESTAWWISFGSYGLGKAGNTLPYMAGFTGVGTMGGGNLTMTVGGNTGITGARGTFTEGLRSQGLVTAIGSTGRVDSDGNLTLTGGGDLIMRVDGSINPDLTATQFGNSGTNSQNLNLNGAIVNLRGLTSVSATDIGGIELRYRTSRTPTRGYDFDTADTRPSNPFEASLARSSAGITLMPGDSAMYLDTFGDLVIATVGDAGRVFTPHKTTFDFNSQSYNNSGQTWFTLWTDRTAINLFSAGSNVTPGTDVAEIAKEYDSNYAEGGGYVYPSTLRATAASGSIYYGYSAAPLPSRSVFNNMVMAPSSSGALEFLAADSLYGGGYGVSMSGSDMAIATPFNPAFAGFRNGFALMVANTSKEGTMLDASTPVAAKSNNFPLFVFGPDSVRNTDLHAGSDASTLFYAVNGDIVGLTSGQLETGRRSAIWKTWYRTAMPARVRAGRDVVSANVFALNNDATDITLVEAGRDILYSNVKVAGPGTLEMSAGRHIMQGDVASVESLGAIVSGDTRAGADIIMMAGMAEGVNFTAIRNLYLDPQYQANLDLPLADQPGKVAKTYQAELATWLDKRYGVTGDTTQLLAYFDGLAPEQQRIFLRDVYYSELREGAREYTNPDSRRYQSYLRSRQMIATLFPDTDAQGNTIVRNGNITMFGNMGVHTNFGGDIQMMAPGGQLILGTQQASVPAATSGLVTQGQGDIQLFTEQSILLGLSRIMTTFGGDIFAWSEEGDINAGRGAKTTVLYTPPKRVYDELGNVALSPQVPSSGAGIATLNPIAEVAPGDVDLIAPLGTIDAGEAGIRVSGNVNIIAPRVANAENIKVQGDSAGLPMIASANIGALTSATAASSAAAIGAQEMLQRDRANARNNLPSVFTVRVLGFGNEPVQKSETDTVMPSAAVSSVTTNTPYNPNSFLQIVGHGDQLKPELLSQLSEKERQMLKQRR
jgi:filamentous hemagglutinin family protein